MSKAICPKCGSGKTTPIAANWLKQDKTLPLWFCYACKYEWGKSEAVENNTDVPDEES
ncbi:MAG: hypothetical protein GY754_16190 [bacterium]|nr:hypothetical protein [bacterium]